MKNITNIKAKNEWLKQEIYKKFNNDNIDDFNFTETKFYMWLEWENIDEIKDWYWVLSNFQRDDVKNLKHSELEKTEGLIYFRFYNKNLLRYSVRKNFIIIDRKSFDDYKIIMDKLKTKHTIDRAANIINIYEIYLIHVELKNERNNIFMKTREEEKQILESIKHEDKVLERTIEINSSFFADYKDDDKVNSASNEKPAIVDKDNNSNVINKNTKEAVSKENNKSLWLTLAMLFFAITFLAAAACLVVFEVWFSQSQEWMICEIAEMGISFICFILLAYYNHKINAKEKEIIKESKNSNI